MKLVITRDRHARVTSVVLTDVPADAGNIELPNVQAVQITDRLMHTPVVGIEFGIGGNLELIQRTEGE